jgi:hypothetical protein
MRLTRREHFRVNHRTLFVCISLFVLPTVCSVNHSKSLQIECVNDSLKVPPFRETGSRMLYNRENREMSKTIARTMNHPTGNIGRKRAREKEFNGTSFLAVCVIRFQSQARKIAFHAITIRKYLESPSAIFTYVFCSMKYV